MLEVSRLPERTYRSGDALYVQGAPSDELFILQSGWVALHRDLTNRRRHIGRFVLPGAMFGGEAGTPAHGATAVTDAAVRLIDRATFDALRGQHRELNEQYVRALEDDNRRLFEMLATIGQTTAKERVAKLLTDLVLAATGLAEIPADTAFSLPLTQSLIAQATGLSHVHVNRVLKSLREDRAAAFRDGEFVVIEPETLRALTQPRAGRRGRSRG
jgi:CRP/FNR family transcriptional regulator, anaerobic regulatory protein